MDPLAQGRAARFVAKPGMAARLDLRPYQLMRIVYRIGEGRSVELGCPRLTQILAGVGKAPKVSIRLRMTADSLSSYQNPGPAI